MENVVMRQYHVKLQLCGVQQCGHQQQRRRLLRRQLGEGGAGENRFDDYHNRVKSFLKKKYFHDPSFAKPPTDNKLLFPTYVHCTALLYMCT